jgi:GT2 family glycosyltransferase
MTEPRPRASVVVPTHRGAHRLPVLLDALAEQDCADPWELVVVVDGPDPETEALLPAWEGRLPLRVVRRDVSTGVAAALNDGYHAAQGQVVIRCDDDLTPGPDMVRRHLAHHVDGSRVGVVGPTRDALAASRYARAYGWAATERGLHGVLTRDPEHAWLHWAAHNSVRRTDFDAVGGFDEEFLYRQDSELGLRLARDGVRIVIDPELVVEHRGAAQDARTRCARAWVSGASEVLFEHRHPGTRARPAAAAPSSWSQRLWLGATRALAATLTTRDRAGTAGRVADSVLVVLPASLGGRVVALVVESAALAGRRHGSPDQLLYRAQKSAELDRERDGRPGS